MLAGHEVALPLDLRPDRDHENFALAQLTIKIAPRLELRHAIGAPAPAKKLDDEWTERQQIRRAYYLAIGIFQCKFRSYRTDREDALLQASCKQLFDSTLADRQSLRLHPVARVGSDLVELVLERGHRLHPTAQTSAGRRGPSRQGRRASCSSPGRLCPSA